MGFRKTITYRKIHGQLKFKLSMGTKKAHYVFHTMFSNPNSIHSNSSKKLVKGFEEHMMNVFLESIVQELELAFLERFI